MDLANNFETAASIIIIIVLGIVVEVFIYVQTYGSGIAITDKAKRDFKKRVGLVMIFIVALLIGIKLILLVGKLFNEIS